MTVIYATVPISVITELQDYLCNHGAEDVSGWEVEIRLYRANARSFGPDAASRLLFTIWASHEGDNLYVTPSKRSPAAVEGASTNGGTPKANGGSASSASASTSATPQPSQSLPPEASNPPGDGLSGAPASGPSDDPSESPSDGGILTSRSFQEILETKLQTLWQHRQTFKGAGRILRVDDGGEIRISNVLVQGNYKGLLVDSDSTPQCAELIKLLADEFQIKAESSEEDMQKTGIDRARLYHRVYH